MPQRVAITGASGLIGGALSHALAARGDEVVHLVRRSPKAPHERPWDPANAALDPASLDGVDAVVHLAGAGVADHRWTSDYRNEILRSRVAGTTAVANAIAATARPIRLVSGSAIGFYGDRGDEELTETSGPGTGFLAEVVRAWESATGPAIDSGAPVAMSRTGLVMTPAGGAAARMLPLAKRGLGGPLGSGRQWWPVITLPDAIQALIWLVDHPELRGPVNVVGPDPAPQREVARTLGAALGRPALLPAPATALRLVLGGFAEDILASHRVRPKVLQDNGFTFQHASLDEAMTWLARADAEHKPDGPGA